MNGKHRRKLLNYSVKSGLQIRLLLKVLSIVAVGVGLMAVVFYFYSNREITESYRQFHIHAKNFLDYLLPAVILSLVLAFLCAIAITLFFPQKIAGPLYRIERDLKEKVGNGDLTVRFILRKGDDVKDLAEAINISLERLRDKVKMIQQPAKELESVITDMQGKVDKEIERLTKEINRALQEFRV